MRRHRALAGVALAVPAVMLLRCIFSVVTVKGMSMAPTLRPGQRLLMARRVVRQYQSGDIVLVRSPEAAGQLLVKRLVAVAGQTLPDEVRASHAGAAAAVVPREHVVILGEHPASLDSKRWGPIAVGLVQARLVAVLP